MRNAIALVLVVSMSGLGAREALGQPPVQTPDRSGYAGPEDAIPAPRDAFELQFNAGYVQPFGQLSRTIDMGDIADAGFTGGGSLAWRLNPRYAVVGYGGFGHWAPDDRLDDGSVFGGAGGLAASFHFRPYALVDPVLQIGAGYRLLFVAPGDERHNHMLHGFQVLRADFVLDFRVTEDFALGPMISADLNVLPWDLDTSTGDHGATATPRASTFFFAGVAGRHDLLGTRVTSDGGAPELAAASAPRR